MVPTAMDFGGKYAKRNQKQRKKIAENVLEGEIEKKREDVIYNLETLELWVCVYISKRGE